MILSLSIKNIALIDSLSLEFDRGLNILSGETGAGKSIIIDSLNFVLGDRADRSLIRRGERSAEVQVVFEGTEAIAPLLEQYGIPLDDVVIVRRTMSEAGRSDCRINGIIVNLSTLKAVVERLVDVHSQHEHQSLLNEGNHIGILDRYDGAIVSAKQAYRAVYDRLQEIERQLSRYPDPESRLRLIDTLSYQIGEIEQAAIGEEEEEELLRLRAKFQNAQKIGEGLSAALSLLRGEGAFAALQSVYAARKELQAIDRYDSAYAELAERLDSCRIELGDIADTVQAELDRVDLDPAEQRQVEERIELIRKLKKRYGSTVKEVLAFGMRAQEELERLQQAADHIEALEKERDEAQKMLTDCAKSLHVARLQAAQILAESIGRNLKELGMKNSRFAAEIVFPDAESDLLAACGPNGADEVRFMISPNLGEPLKPLAKIASGGEMSRFMLGLKSITAELEGIDTLVFDEIDTGISGAIAKVVAHKLYRIADTRQVLAVTHLPQLASMADNHYLIRKTEGDGKTLTNVIRLDREASLREIMRLSGSAEDSASGYQNAVEMKEDADRFKRETSKN